MGNAIFRGLTAPKPFDGFSKNCTVGYVGDPTPHANVGINRFKGACLRMREFVAVRRHFFSLLFLSPLIKGPMRIATGLTVGPINAVNGSNDASWWHSYSFMVWIIKINIFSSFHPKI